MIVIYYVLQCLGIATKTFPQISLESKMEKLVYSCILQLTQNRHAQYLHPTCVQTHLCSDVKGVCHDNI